MQPIHILNQMGILSSFSVAKKITDEEVEKYFSKHKKNGKTEAEVEKMVKEKITNDIEDALKNNKIPGLVSSQELASQLGIEKDVIEKMPELNRLIMVVANKLMERKYSKMALCYIINSLVNILGLTEKDFKKFHQKNAENKEDAAEFGEDPGDDEDDGGEDNFGDDDIEKF
jgi:hypothetical protein